LVLAQRGEAETEELPGLQVCDGLPREQEEREERKKKWGLFGGEWLGVLQFFDGAVEE